MAGNTEPIEANTVLANPIGCSFAALINEDTLSVKPSPFVLAASKALISFLAESDNKLYASDFKSDPNTFAALF